MPPSAYDACPCGSGKKFKWCCTPYFEQIELALEQQQQGQHDAALRTMDSVTKAFPDRPQVWGYFGHILFAEGKTEEAEAAIVKAFAVQPDFAMGHLLRGLFRQSEGEMIGALMLFRKAAEAYPPDAHDQLAQVCEMIARNEIMLNRPVAARAALERAVHCQPGDPELRQQFDALFSDQSRLPEAARKKYAIRPMTKALPVAAQTGKLSDAKKAFETVAKDAPSDPAVWFNLGLVRAWLGEQPMAVDALLKSLELEVDDHRAEEAGALVEVLKCGQGMENDADFVENRVFFPIRDAEALFGLLQAWDQEGRLLAAQSDQQGTFFSALVVDQLPSLLETGTTMATVQANLNIVGGVARLWHPVAEAVRTVATEVRDRVNLAVGEPTTGIGPAQFGDICLEALAYPVRTANVGEAEGKLHDHAANFYENVWLHRPLRSLAGASPIDAVGSSLLRKRLIGIIRFLEDCMSGSAPRKQTAGVVAPIQVYDFARLRHKLGIEMQSVAAPDAPPPEQLAVKAAPPPPVAVKREISAMSAADLAGLAKDDLSPAEAEDAMRAAIRLDARELAVAFARAGAAKPADPARPDRYPLFACLMTASLAEGKVADALAHARTGANADLAQNEGKRANDYGLRIAGLLAKSGDGDGAAKAFDDLIERNPDDGNFYVKAAESMLGAKQGAKAAYFAEKGIEKARAVGNRDLEAACREIADAAKRYA